MIAARQPLHRVATHVLGRARHRATGKFGLRATPGGFGTPAFGDAVEVLRVDGPVLLRERDGALDAIEIDGSTLSKLAAFAGVDLAEPFEAGPDTPPVGDPNEPLAIDTADVGVLAAWWDLGWRAADVVAAGCAAACTVQLWPEHFDAGCWVDIAVAGTGGSGGAGGPARCNLGASPGDGFDDEPYLYVGPWGPERPGDRDFWNAPFGAVLRRADVVTTPDPYATALAFFRQGVRALDAAG